MFRGLVSRGLPVCCLVVSAVLLSPTRVHADETEKDAAKALIERFKAEDAEAREKAAIESAANGESCLTSPLLKLLKDDYVSVREAALGALATRTDKGSRRKASSTLVSRLRKLEKSNADRPELLLTLKTIGRLGDARAVRPLLDAIEPETDQELAKARFMAVAEIPHKDAIERLINYLDKWRRRGDMQNHRRMALNALQYASGQKIGGDPDKWRAWWREAEDGFDFEHMRQLREAALQEAADKAARREAAKREREEQRARKKQEREERAKKAPGKKKDEGTEGSGA